MAALGRRSVLTSLVSWDSHDGHTFHEKVNAELVALRGRGASIVYVDYQQSVAAGSGGDAGFYLLVRSALIVYEVTEP